MCGPVRTMMRLRSIMLLSRSSRAHQLTVPQQQHLIIVLKDPRVDRLHGGSRVPRMRVRIRDTQRKHGWAAYCRLRHGHMMARRRRRRLQGRRVLPQGQMLWSWRLLHRRQRFCVLHVLHVLPGLSVLLRLHKLLRRRGILRMDEVLMLVL